MMPEPMKGMVKPRMATCHNERSCGTDQLNMQYAQPQQTPKMYPERM